VLAECSVFEVDDSLVVSLKAGAPASNWESAEMVIADP